MRNEIFAKNVAWQYGLQIVRYAFPFIIIPYLTRVLTPDYYAIYVYVLAFMVFFEVVTEFGFNLLGTKEIASCRDSKEDMGLVLGSILESRTMVAIVLMVVLGIVVQFVPILTNNLLYTFLAFFAVALRALMPDFVFQGLEDMGPITVRFFMSKTISTIMVFILVHSHDDMLWIPVLDVIGNSVALIWSLWTIRKKYGVRPRRSNRHKILLNVRISAQYCFSNVASQVFSGAATIVIGFSSVAPSCIAYWGLCMTVLSAISSLYSPIINSLYSHMVAQRDVELIKRVFFVSLPAVLCLSMCIALFSHTIMLFLGGSDYQSGSSMLLCLAPITFFSFYSMFFGWPTLGIFGRTELLTRTTVLVAGIYIIALVYWLLTGSASLIVVALMRDCAEVLLCGLRLYGCSKLRQVK